MFSLFVQCWAGIITSVNTPLCASLSVLAHLASSVVHSKASGDLDAEVERCQSLSGVGEDDDEDGDTMDMNTGAVQ